MKGFSRISVLGIMTALGGTVMIGNSATAQQYSPVSVNGDVQVNWDVADQFGSQPTVPNYLSPQQARTHISVPGQDLVYPEARPHSRFLASELLGTGNGAYDNGDSFETVVIDGSGSNEAPARSQFYGVPGVAAPAPAPQRSAQNAARSRPAARSTTAERATSAPAPAPAPISPSADDGANQVIALEHPAPVAPRSKPAPRPVQTAQAETPAPAAAPVSAPEPAPAPAPASTASTLVPGGSSLGGPTHLTPAAPATDAPDAPEAPARSDLADASAIPEAATPAPDTTTSPEEMTRAPQAPAPVSTAPAQIAEAPKAAPAPAKPAPVDVAANSTPAAPKAATPAPAATPAAPAAETAAVPPSRNDPAQQATAPAGDGEYSLAFGNGSFELAETARQQLGRIVAAMAKDENLRIQLQAYAEGDSANASKARRLSLSRALQVRSYLIDNGVRSTRIDVRALGSNVPEGSGPADRVDIKTVQR